MTSAVVGTEGGAVVKCRLASSNKVLETMAAARTVCATYHSFAQARPERDMLG